MPSDARVNATRVDPERIWLRRLRVASFVEGTTLVALVCIAVPLKHAFGIPAATAIVGPIHGFAFMAYVWLAINALSGGDWTRAQGVRLIGAAFVPFGAFFNVRLLKAKEAAIPA